MWNDIKSLFGGRRSSESAKGRLHLVIAHDRAGLDGARMQEMRREIADVIAKYVSIDLEEVDIQIERVNRNDTQLKVSSPLRAR